MNMNKNEYDNALVALMRPSVLFGVSLKPPAVGRNGRKRYKSLRSSLLTHYFWYSLYALFICKHLCIGFLLMRFYHSFFLQ